MAVKKTATRKSGPSRTTAKAKAKVGKVMHEFKHGELKSGGRRKVTDPKQAIAIGLSEARRAGADIPAGKKPAARKKSTARKIRARQS